MIFMELNRWWLEQPDEIYWMEFTDRRDLGLDLNAPQLRDDGKEYYGYPLITEIKEGDIVFQYHINLSFSLVLLHVLPQFSMKHTLSRSTAQCSNPSTNYGCLSQGSTRAFRI